VGGRKTKHDTPVTLDDWELELIQRATYGFDTKERDELAAELMQSALALKKSAPVGVGNWKAYFAKAVYNRAANVVRGWRRRDKRVASLDALEGIRHRPPASIEDNLAFRQAWAELDPELKSLWKVLAEEAGNQARTARRLGVHRNTVRLWTLKIRQVLRKHGF
jgi:DNA-directed RNA polymerase specialized sigma24 family protein